VSAPAAVPVLVRRSAPPEDAARADFYALLARLFTAPPDSSLLASLAAAGAIPSGGDPDLGRAWQALVDASSAMDADAALDEFETLFVGTGKARVSLYAGHYLGAPSIDHPRVRIMNDLAKLGLGRPGTVTEPEDHFAGLFEVMRVLAAGGAGRDPAPLAVQKEFHQAHLEAGMAKFFAAVASAPGSNYYRRVAAVGAAFAALETQSFGLD
jgi:TorA maturation chaperone TorD